MNRRRRKGERFCPRTGPISLNNISLSPLAGVFRKELPSLIFFFHFLLWMIGGVHWKWDIDVVTTLLGAELEDVNLASEVALTHLCWLWLYPVLQTFGLLMGSGLGKRISVRIASASADIRERQERTTIIAFWQIWTWERDVTEQKSSWAFLILWN